MDLKFKVMIHVARPVGEVFEAVADPQQLSSYFTTGGASGRLEAGKTVTWDFHDFPGAFPVDVDAVVPDERIVLRWEAAEGGQVSDDGIDITSAGYQTIVTMTFKPTDCQHRGEGLAQDRERPPGELRQLHGLVADARGIEGVEGVRNQPSRGGV